MITVLAVAISVLVASDADNQTKDEYKTADSSKYAVSFIDSQAEHEFQYGEIAILEKPIKNVGSEPVHVKAVINRSCGCQGASKTNKEVFLPGETGTIRLIVNTRQMRPGINREWYDIITNDNKIIHIATDVRTLVRKDIAFQTQNIELGKIVDDCKPIKWKIDVVSTLPIQDNAFVTRSSTSDILATIIRDRETPPVESNSTKVIRYQLVVSYLNGRKAGSSINEYIDVCVKNCRSRDASFRIGVSGSVVSCIQSNPDNLFLGYVEPNRNFEKSLEVFDSNMGTIDIEKITFPENINAQYTVLNVSRSRKNLLLKLSISAIKDCIGKFVIIINATSNGKHYVLNVPCIYIGKPSNK